MPRQQSSNNRSAPSSGPKLPVYAPPPKIWHASPPALNTPSMWQSVKDGIGLGAGSAIGHRIVGGIMGPPSAPSAMPVPSTSIPPLNQPQQQQPYFASEHYMLCVETNAKNPQICRPFLSKDKSPWTLCMEQNFFRADLCTSEKIMNQ